MVHQSQFRPCRLSLKEPITGPGPNHILSNDWEVLIKPQRLVLFKNNHSSINTWEIFKDHSADKIIYFIL